MAKQTLDFKGAKKLRRELRQAGADMQDLKDVNGRAATTVRAHARPLTPYKSGDLQSTIRSSGTQTAGIIRAGNNTWLPYARPIHWGWKARNIEPQRWVLNSAYATRPKWLEQYQKEIEEIIAKCKGMKL